MDIVLEKPPARIVNPDNFMREIGLRDWQYLCKVVLGRDSRELERLIKFFEEPAKRAGRERRSIKVRTKSVIPQHKILTPYSIANSLNLETAVFMDKNEVKNLRLRVALTKKDSLERQLINTTIDNVEEAVLERIKAETEGPKRWEFMSEVIDQHGRTPWYQSGRDPLLDLVSYHLTMSIFGSIFY